MGEVLVDGGGPEESAVLGGDDGAGLFGVGDGDLFLKRSCFGEEGLEGGYVGEPKRGNVRCTGLETEVGGECDCAKDERN